jgi:hypothetical protein
MAERAAARTNPRLQDLEFLAGEWEHDFDVTYQRKGATP